MKSRIDAFSSTYAIAREKFVTQADRLGLEVVSFENPERGPAGERLLTDVVCQGPPDAPMVLLANSATHGVEGFCGSAALVDWLCAEPELPPGVRVVLVHAINPYGFAWLRRVTEDNVDLNRNFIDHYCGGPENLDYALLHDEVVPSEPPALDAEVVNALFGRFAKDGDYFAVQSALSRGQYSHAEGVFYGGQRAGWSNVTFQAILARFVQGAAHVAFLDFHTGLGPYGHAELISKCLPDAPEFHRLTQWYGPAVKTSAAGESTSPMLSGLIATAVRNIAPADAVSAITVEYGTYPLMEIMHAVLVDNWLYQRGDPTSEYGERVTALIKERFYPDDDDWRELVVVRAHQLMLRAARGLATMPAAARG
jgi:predicted deacylase